MNPRLPPCVAERAYAEWIAAKAREATGIYAEALATWGQALPEHGLASVGNAEGAHAAAEADARSPAIRFRPSARPECFLGTLMPAGEDGRRHMRPSLELTEAQRDATATLPSTVPIPTENDIQRDPRVAWDDAWRMWNPTPRRLGWKLTAEQHAQVQRQRLAAVARRAATHTAHPRPTGATITGAQAEETAPGRREAHPGGSPGIPNAPATIPSRRERMGTDATPQQTRTATGGTRGRSPRRRARCNRWHRLPPRVQRRHHEMGTAPKSPSTGNPGPAPRRA